MWNLKASPGSMARVNTFVWKWPKLWLSNHRLTRSTGHSFWGHSLIAKQCGSPLLSAELRKRIESSGLGKAIW